MAVCRRQTERTCRGGRGTTLVVPQYGFVRGRSPGLAEGGSLCQTASHAGNSGESLFWAQEHVTGGQTAVTSAWKNKRVVSVRTASVASFLI